MRRFLTLLLVFTLVIANGPAVAGAICRHESLAGHSVARISKDARISGVALGEEAADSIPSKKGALASAVAIAWVADLSRGPQLTIPFGLTRPVDPEMAPVRPLVGRSLTPLLQPPSA
jgi:hypothetical protein